ncbi:MAG: TRAP transporter large permease subunit [Sulfolobales archaeon]|nr:TRAP transporter large permease subunit [Sulfolobales archaeon]MDW8083058.1 TRAP transporter large permease subunit [Sulfolobales archaeon]
MVSVTPITMFLVLLALILLKVPVSFSLLITSAIFALTLWGERGLYTLYHSFYTMMNNWVLVALPLFVFMSAVLEKSGVVEEMFQPLSKILGKYRGSLAIIAVILGFAIGAMSGVVAAATAALALVVYPLMARARYDKKLSVGSVLAAGTLPQIVPPSTNAIMYGAVAGVSVGGIFAGGLVLGAIMAVLFSIYIAIWSWLNKDKVPVISISEASLGEKILSLRYLVGPLLIILSVLGSIFTGIATPTEASGVGALASLIYVAARRRLSRKNLVDSLVTTIKVTSMACWLMAAGGAFSSIFSAVGGRVMVLNAMLNLPRAELLAPTISVLLIFVLGMFIDPVSIIMILGPILDPVIRSLGYNPVWWGVIFCGTLITSYVTPPVGMGLYYFKGVVGEEVPMAEIFKSVFPYVGLMLISIAIVFLKPDLVLWFR